MNIEFAPHMRPLFQPFRYKILYGGRNGLKSWSIARALLLLGAQRPLRILCTREVQKSIRDSVHKLLKDQAQRLDLGAFYDVQRAVVIGANGTEFIFAGLSDQTKESIKSYEGVDIAWVEEARGVSDASWTILLPTIRKAGSQIWISLNPGLDTDATWTRFVVNPRPDSVIIETNWRNNPWRTKESEAERLTDKGKMTPDEYNNVWEGKPMAAEVGAIYRDEILWLAEQKRITTVDYDPAFKVHAVWDLGWNDAMTVILVQKHLSTLRIIGYLEYSHKTYDWFSAELRLLRYNWGSCWLPHDGAHKNAQTAKSAQEVLQALGWDVKITENFTVEHGIKLTRMALKNMYFDKVAAARLIECIRRYKRDIPVKTGEPGAPKHDEYSHGADALRYLAVNADKLTNETWGGQKLVYPNMRNA